MRRPAKSSTESETYRVTDTYAAPTLRLRLPLARMVHPRHIQQTEFGFNYTTIHGTESRRARSLAWQWTSAWRGGTTSRPTTISLPFRILFDGVWFLDEFKS